MANITVDFMKRVSGMKVMHAVNNGPIRESSVEQTRGNFAAYKRARIPYARTHDASFCSDYGGEHTVDVIAVFPDFKANPYDERSYDFQLTDEYLLTIHEAGTEVFFRLGNKIEHWSKKYGTVVPADFRKWAVICEHIIRHYNEGWAHGYHLGITYWEIWNEADGKTSDGSQPNWSGTPEEYYEFYEIAATHLKSRFPHLKIGGPALSWLENREWVTGFFESLTRNGKHVVLDFFSWHFYGSNVEGFCNLQKYARKLLDSYGYTETESICDEWNYLVNFTDKFIDSVLGIISARGAAFTASAMIAAQDQPVDMLMYYDARPTCFNGLFDYYTLRPLKGYYSILAFSELYALEHEVLCSGDDKEVYVLAAEKDDRKAMMVTYYSADREKTEEKTVVIDENSGDALFCYLTDESDTFRPFTPVKEGNRLVLRLKPNSIVYLSNTEVN